MHGPWLCQTTLIYIQNIDVSIVKDTTKFILVKLFNEGKAWSNNKPVLG